MNNLPLCLKILWSDMRIQLKIYN